MFEKDYLMRLIQTLMDAINRIINNIDKGDIEEAKKQLTDSYKLLDNNESYFFEKNYEEIVAFFKLKEGNHLKRVEILAELLFLDASIETDKIIKKNKIAKSEQLFKHYLQFSKEYSFEIKNKLALIETELEKF
jgi:ATP/maltotriose-dependent transcriptional regulator MalT